MSHGARLSPALVPWEEDGWRGWIDAAAGLDAAVCLGALERAARRSRHARTARLERPDGPVYVKGYPPPGGWRALRSHRMSGALLRAGFGAPEVVAVARRAGAGLLVTRDVGGEDLLAAVAECRADRNARRTLLRRVGREVGRLHDAGFVHGDLVPSNVRVVGGDLVFLDNDRTRRSRLLVRLGGRRNLVQLGRFVVPGVTLADRARVLAAYAEARRLSRGARRRLAWWVVHKTTARRCAIDGIPAEQASRAGYALLMRSGGPFDRTARA